MFTDKIYSEFIGISLVGWQFSYYWKALLFLLLEGIIVSTTFALVWKCGNILWEVILYFILWKVTLFTVAWWNILSVNYMLRSLSKCQMVSVLDWNV